MGLKPVKLTSDEQVALTRSEHAMSVLLTQLDKAEQCDMQCEELRQMAATIIQKIQALRSNFGTQ